MDMSSITEQSVLLSDHENSSQINEERLNNSNASFNADNTNETPSQSFNNSPNATNSFTINSSNFDENNTPNRLNSPLNVQKVTPHCEGNNTSNTSSLGLSSVSIIFFKIIILRNFVT